MGHLKLPSYLSRDSCFGLQEESIKKTLAGLDALLGIDPEEELKKKAAEQVKKVFNSWSTLIYIFTSLMIVS